MNDGKIQYRDSLVIFIDLLGTQDRTDFEELYNINSIFHEQFEGNQANDSVNKRYYRKIFTFSDCAYIIYRDKENNPNNKGKLIAVALNNTLPVLTKFLQERMPFRGGISYGDVYFDDDRSMFFGNAINKAYQIESSISVHPRIVVDEDVADSVLKYIAEEKYKQPDYAIYCGMGFFPKYPESLEGIVEQDIDGKYIFNYLFLQENDEPFDVIGSSCEEFLKSLIDFCSEQINPTQKMKIIDKYRYLLDFCEKKLVRLKGNRE